MISQGQWCLQLWWPIREKNKSLFSFLYTIVSELGFFLLSPFSLSPRGLCCLFLCLQYNHSSISVSYLFCWFLERSQHSCPLYTHGPETNMFSLVIPLKAQTHTSLLGTLKLSWETEFVSPCLGFSGRGIAVLFNPAPHRLFIAMATGTDGFIFPSQRF